MKAATMRRSAPITTRSVLAASVLLAAASCTADHGSLDWSAPYRWVHVDNVDTAKSATFEDARKEWLRAVRRGDRMLGDGRPVFWQARSGPTQTFYTFFPFARFADLDARVDMVRATNAAVGQAAVDRYDLGDAALVAPHFTQVWRRDADFDAATTATAWLTEVTASVGRLEFQQEDLESGDDAREVWKTAREALASQKYPLACRTFRSAFGSGELVRLWLAPDARTLAETPPLRTVLTRALGDARGADVTNRLDRLLATRQVIAVERRPDLSNLGG